MAYTKRNFQREQLLTAEDLNAMDEQIATNEKNAKSAKSDAETARKSADDAMSAVRGAFVDKGVLTSEDKLDDIKEPGMYSWYTDAPIGNPVSDAALMTVFRSDNQNIITQTVTSMYREEKTKKRTMYPSGWSDWSELLEDDSELMIFRRTLTASDDFNAVTQIGVYNYNGDNAPANAPFTTGGVTVIVYGDATQIATARFQGKLHLKVRCGIPNTESWSSWHDLINNGLVYRGSLFDVDDLNDVVEDGIYNITNNKNGDLPSNMPDGIEDYGGTMMVYGYTGNLPNMIVQTMLVTPAIGHGIIPQFKLRIGTNSGVWTSWTSLTDVGQLEEIEIKVADLEKQLEKMTSGSSGASDQIRVLGNAAYTTGIMEFYRDHKSDIIRESHCLECTKGADGFTVILSPGNACISGMFFGLNEEKTFTFDPSKTEEDSYQTYIGIKAYPETGIVTLDVKEDFGARYWPSEERYELGLAWIYAPAGSTDPSKMTVTDIRFGYEDKTHGISFVQKEARYLGFPGERIYQIEQERVLSRLYTNGILDDKLMSDLVPHNYTHRSTIDQQKEPFGLTITETQDELAIKFNAGCLMVDGRVFFATAITDHFTHSNTINGEDQNIILGLRYNKQTGAIDHIRQNVQILDVGNFIAGKDQTTGELREFPSYEESGIFEAIFATIQIPAEATKLTADMVTDTRHSKFCGFSRSAIQNMYGTQERPTYNGKEIALLEDFVPAEGGSY